MFARYGFATVKLSSCGELSLNSSKFIQFRQRRFFRIGTGVAFLLVMGILAALHLHEHSAALDNQHFADTEASFR